MDITGFISVKVTKTLTSCLITMKDRPVTYLDEKSPSILTILLYNVKIGCTDWHSLDVTFYMFSPYKLLNVYMHIQIINPWNQDTILMKGWTVPMIWYYIIYSCTFLLLELTVPYMNKLDASTWDRFLRYSPVLNWSTVSSSLRWWQTAYFKLYHMIQSHLLVNGMLTCYHGNPYLDHQH